MALKHAWEVTETCGSALAACSSCEPGQEREQRHQRRAQRRVVRGVRRADVMRRAEVVTAHRYGLEGGAPSCNAPSGNRKIRSVKADADTAAVATDASAAAVRATAPATATAATSRRVSALHVLVSERRKPAAMYLEGAGKTCHLILPR